MLLKPGINGELFRLQLLEYSSDVSWSPPFLEILPFYQYLRRIQPSSSVPESSCWLVVGQKSNSPFMMNHHQQNGSCSTPPQNSPLYYWGSQMFACPCSILSQLRAMASTSARISQRCLALVVALAHAALNELGQQLHGWEIEHHGGRQGDSCESCRSLEDVNGKDLEVSSRLWGSPISRNPHLGMTWYDWIPTLLEISKADTATRECNCRIPLNMEDPCPNCHVYQAESGCCGLWVFGSGLETPDW